MCVNLKKCSSSILFFVMKELLKRYRPKRQDKVQVPFGPNAAISVRCAAFTEARRPVSGVMLMAARGGIFGGSQGRIFAP